jgi:hypothetical protein
MYTSYILLIASSRPNGLGPGIAVVVPNRQWRGFVLLDSSAGARHRRTSAGYKGYKGYAARSTVAGARGQRRKWGPYGHTDEANPKPT